MTDRDYAIKSMKEITFQMASHAQDYLEVTIERHYTDIKELMTSYQKLILENQIVLEELDMECQEKINEDMAYALSYLSIYNNQLNVPKMHREMNNLMIIYGLSDMIYRGMTLVKFYAPNGVMLSEILHSCFCSHYNKGMTAEEYRNYLEQDFSDVDINEMTDLRMIKADRNKSLQERRDIFLNKVGNPYLVRIGNMKVKVRFANNGISMEQAFENMLLSV